MRDNYTIMVPTVTTLECDICPPFVAPTTFSRRPRQVYAARAHLQSQAESQIHLLSSQCYLIEEDYQSF